MVNITAATTHFVASICIVAVKLSVRGMRPLIEQLCNILSRIKLYANRQDQISVLKGDERGRGSLFCLDLIRPSSLSQSVLQLQSR